MRLLKPGKLVLLAALLFSMTLLQAQTYHYDDAWGKAGLTLNSQYVTGVNFTFSIPEFSLVENEIDGVPMKNIQMPEVLLPNNEGAPDLPGFGRYIAVPQGAKAILNVISYRTETIENVEMAPAPRIPLDTDNGPLVYNRDRKIYDQNAFYPSQPFMLSEQTEIRGVDAVVVGITPFQYNPVTKQLIVYRDIELEVAFQGGSSQFGDNRYRNRYFDQILEDVFANYESLPVIDYGARYKNPNHRDLTGYEYLIVVPNNPIWMTYAEQVKEWRTLQGIYTGIVTLSEIGGNTATVLENYFNNAYNTWDIPPVAVLLMADYGTDANNSIISPIWDSYCVSDNIFADVNNNDMPDIIFARMTAQNETHLQTMVSKMINYESNPPTDYNFYHKPITALGWQTERWFQICSETVGGYWREVKGKQPVRINAIYSGTPGSTWSTATNTAQVVNYFGPNGQGYIPATPAELGGWSGGTPQMVINAINDGAFALQHRDHGMETGWGEPAFVSSHISSLTNNQNNELCYVFSINCLTGKYNMSGECFTEKFHRYTYNGQNAGALGLIAASEVSYSFVNDAYVWGMMDNMYPDFMPTYGNYVDERGFLPAFGNAAGKYFLQQSNWPYNTGDKEVTYNLFHAHGGAFLQVYTEVPQTLAVTHNPILYAGESSFTVVADAGAIIALTVNGEIIGVAESAGGATSITIEPQLPPNQMIVTVTKQNYFRYESTVDVIPPSGPYVVGDSYVINDPTGNNNGLLDYGESVTMTMTMKNVGVAVANNVNVVISTTDQYITITDNSAGFGTIQPNGTSTVNNAFAFTAAQNIPDNHTVTFLLTATSGTTTWESFISVNGHAPALEFEQFTVSDPNGNNNGFLDPGETATLTVFVGNNGSAAAYNILGVLTSSSQYVTVLTTTPQSYGNLNAGSTASASYMVTAAANTPPGHVAQLNISFTADMGITQQDIIEISFADYCEASTQVEDEYISNVNCGTINNSSGWQGGVANYTNLTVTVVPGVAKPITVSNGNAWASDIVYAWVDWNMNKTLGDPGELFQLTNVGGTGQTFTGNITAPANQQGGQYRMRIRMTYSTAPTPCGSATYGEVEDYTVVIEGGATLNPPQNLTAAIVNDNDVEINWDAPATEALLGYNVYRNGVMIAQQITPTEYMDMDMAPGTYNYQVCAVYTEGMSPMAGPVQVVVTGGGTSNAWETFEDYTAGGKLAQQANAMGRDYWTTWSNQPGGAEDPVVSNTVAHDGNNSVVIEGTNDCVLLLGNKTTGKWSLNFYVYIPSGFYGYFNVLQDFAGTSSVWGMQTYFDTGGVGSVDAGGQGAGSFTYSYDTWTFCEVVVDLNADWAEFYVDGADVVQWQWSLGTFGTPGPVQLSAANFYAWAENGTPKAYYDDIDFKTFSNALIFEPFEAYTAGEQLAEQAVAMGIDYWTTWSNTPGSTEDPYVSSEQAHEGTNSVLCQGVVDAVLLLGDKTSGKYAINFYLYVPTGKVAYYNILQAFAGANSTWGMEVYYNPNGIALVTADGAAGAAQFNYSYDQWIYMQHVIDLNSDEATLFADGNEVITWQWSVGASGGGINQLAAIDIYAATTNGTPYFFVDDIEYIEYLELAAPSNLVASVVDNDVTLTWNAPASEALLGYNVYRDSDMIAQQISALTFSDYDLLPGTYMYDVKAVYDEGYSAGAGPVPATIAGGTAREMVLVEIGTGTWCVYCPGAAMGADELVEDHNVAVIEYHSGDDYETTESAFRVNTYYGITGFPTAFFDGIVSLVGGNATQSMYASYLPLYENRASKVSLFELELAPEVTGSNTFDITVTAEMIYQYPGNNVVLQVVCTESHIPETWYVMDEVNFVCRDMLPTHTGTFLDFNAQSTYTMTFPLNTGSWDVENCEVVAFLQDNTSKEVLQAVKYNLGNLVGINNPVNESSFSIYPNPADDVITVTSDENINTVKITNYQGQTILVKQTSGTSLNINTSGYPAGVYFIEVTTINGIKTQKLVIR